MKRSFPLTSALILLAAGLTARADTPPATAGTSAPYGPGHIPEERGAIVADQRASNEAQIENTARSDTPPERGRMDPAKAREHRMQVLDEKLQLTADQKQKITAIWDKAEVQGKAIRADESLSREDRRAKAGELMKSTRAEVRTVLTPDQQTKFDALPPERGQRRGPRPEGAGKPPGDANSQ